MGKILTENCERVEEIGERNNIIIYFYLSKKKKIGERRNNIYINRQINIKLDAGLFEFKFAEIVKVGFSDQIWLNLY